MNTKYYFNLVLGLVALILCIIVGYNTYQIVKYRSDTGYSLEGILITVSVAGVVLVVGVVAYFYNRSSGISLVSDDGHARLDRLKELYDIARKFKSTNQATKETAISTIEDLWEGVK